MAWGHGRGSRSAPNHRDQHGRHVALIGALGTLVAVVVLPHPKQRDWTSFKIKGKEEHRNSNLLKITTTR
jgi:hypothetical protein